MFTEYDDTHTIKESEVGETVTLNILIRAGWDTAEQRVLSKTVEL